MRTPFDAALRIQQREVDAIRIEVSVAAEAVISVEQAKLALEDRVRRERDTRTEIWLPHADRWTSHMRHQHERLAQDRLRAESLLEQLRARAAEAYGSMRAIESAAERHRAEQLRESEAAEQAEADDISAVRFLALRRQRASRDA